MKKIITIYVVSMLCLAIISSGIFLNGLFLNHLAQYELLQETEVTNANEVIEIFVQVNKKHKLKGPSISHNTVMPRASCLLRKADLQPMGYKHGLYIRFCALLM